MTIEFGDIEADDAYSQGAIADSSQVAFRLHEIRAYIDALTGSEYTPAFEALDPAEQSIALSIGGVIVQWLIDIDPDDPEKVALHLHNVRRYWSGNKLPAWADLPPEDRQVAVALMSAIIEWLRREGTLPEKP